MIDAEHRRIRAAFRHALRHALRHATLASLFASACSSTSAPASSPVDASTPIDADATTASFETSAADATIDATIDSTIDATTEDAAVDAGSNETDETATDPLASGPCARGPTDAASDADPKCSKFWSLPCGVPAYATVNADCTFPAEQCADLCDYDTATSCQIVGTACSDGGVVSEAGPVQIYCDVCLIGGRRPPRFRADPSLRARPDLGGHFASLACLEAASVPAFRRMVGELRALGAPRTLVRAAAKASRDEARHARMTTRLSRKFGAHPPSPRLARAPNRSLEALAHDNEIEGCVRETFAAIVLEIQASRARDADVSRVFAQLSRDESHHAALSFAIARWARGRLSPTAVARLDRARLREIDRLDAAIGQAPKILADVAGLPSIAQQRGLVRSLRATLWAS
jgi:hypothetical protein